MKCFSVILKFQKVLIIYLFKRKNIFLKIWNLHYKTIKKRQSILFL